MTGLSELVRGNVASFFASLDNIEPFDPADSQLVLDTSPGHSRARPWLESMTAALPTDGQFDRQIC